MKNSILLAGLLFVNTTALVAEPVAKLVQDINIWILIFVELLLLWIYYFIYFFRDRKKNSQIDYQEMKLRIVKKKSA
ncbi:MAG: hypothetical protein KDC69_05965 [Flavobacteriaceae bacterium]|nr:hypothetical protein [Flavobacteriaceae bacterium]